MTNKIHILPPADILDEQPELLYKIGFEDIPQTPGSPAEADVLQRAELGKRLSNIVENIADPLTIALNGGWGSGKTWFLKHWAGAHGLENGGRALTVYISAFNHDYLEDPLPSIILAIDERIVKAEEDETQKPNFDHNENISEKFQNLKKDLKKVKKLAFKFAPAATQIVLRTGAAWATRGVSENYYKEGIKTAEGAAEKAAAAYWRKQDAKQNSIEGFRNTIGDLAETQPLVIIIDELDRAKPDYALAVLEIIKHFFNVKGIKFILGVHSPALAKMVMLRYNLDETNANKYLERFINFSMTLPDTVDEIDRHPSIPRYINGTSTTAERYTGYTIAHMSFSKTLEIAIQNHIRSISYLNEKNSVSFRDVQQIISRCSHHSGLP